jgi:hypothetical protein
MNENLIFVFPVCALHAVLKEQIKLVSQSITAMAAS